MPTDQCRGLVERDLRKVATRWRSARGVAVDVVASLYRLNLEGWLEPTLEVFNNSGIVEYQPIVAAEAKTLFEEDLKTWPRLRQLQRLQRRWQTTVRRQPYEFFIQNSYTGEIR